MKNERLRRRAARFFMANLGATNGGCRNAFKKSVVEGNPRDACVWGTKASSFWELHVEYR